MILKPNYNLKDIYEITPEMLLNMGIKAMFVDLDSTTMISKSGKFEKETLEWFEQFRKDFYIAIVTNNKNPEYTRFAKKAIPFKILENACKPFPAKINKFIKQLYMKPSEVVMIGDRPLTDILAGKLTGMKTILVGSINKNENLPTRIVRVLERLSVYPF